MKTFYQNYRFYYKQNFLIAFMVTNIISISTNPCFAQNNITPDNSLGNEASQITPNINIKGIPSTLIEGGAKRGQNFFHSFSEFNIDEGRGAYFLVPNNSIGNVLTRVTGNNPSNILGIVGTISDRNFSPSNVNLFLINHNGIVFGQNASLDLNGSFVGTTANAVEFGEKGLYSATNPQFPSGLLTVAPGAFLFSQIDKTASIEDNSVADVGLSPSDGLTPKGLRVADGKSLLLLGGDINFDGGGLVALGGRVELGGLAQKGTVGLNIDKNTISLSFPDNLEKSDVTFSNKAGANVGADGGGNIAVNARNLKMTGDSYLYAGIEEGMGSGSTQAGNIDIKANIVNLHTSDIRNEVKKEATGEGGNINIIVNTLLLKDEAAQVSVSTLGKGKGGKLTVDAQDVQISGAKLDKSIHRSGLFALSYSTGSGGEVRVKTNTLQLKEGGVLNVSTYGDGKAGDLKVEAQDIQIIGETLDGEYTSGFFARSQDFQEGDGGTITVKTNNLLVRDGGRITVATFGEGNGGALTIEAQNIQVIGASQKNRYPSRLSVRSSPVSVGNSGYIDIKTNTMLVKDEAEVSAGTFGKGAGGNLTIDARDIELQNKGTITTQSGGASTAGNIDINVKNNFNADNGIVIAQAENSNAGNINITAGKNIFLRKNSDIRTELNTTNRSGGNITLNANAIVALEDSDILAFAPEGRGGNVTFNTNVFLSNPLYRPALQTADRKVLEALDGNNRVDLNASGGISTGTISGVFDANFLQNSLVELAENPIDSEALVASSCVVKSNEINGSFTIAGQSSLRYRPGDTISSQYSAIKVQPVTSNTSSTQNRRWKIGQPIVEPSGIYRLASGKRVLSRECGK